MVKSGVGYNNQLTIISRVVIYMAGQTNCCQVRNHLAGCSLVETPSRGKNVDVIEHLEKGSRRLVDGAYDCSSLMSQELQ